MLTWLTEELSPRSLGLARIILGAAAILRGLAAWPVLIEIAQPEALRIPYADWLPEPSIDLVIPVLGLWLLAAIAFTLGWRVSLTGPILLTVLVVALSMDQQMYGNHLYLMSWLVLLMTLADAGAGRSLGDEERRVVRWPILLLMAQVSIVYAFSALTKLNQGFMSGTVLASVLSGGLVPFPDSLRTPEVLSVVAAMAVAVELFLSIFLWSRRLRPVALTLGVGLHVSIVLFMTPTIELIVFGLEMLAIYVLFADRQYPRISLNHGTVRSSPERSEI